MLNPKDMASVGRLDWCAERKAGVDTMRVETTFLWMSDPSIQMGPRLYAQSELEANAGISLGSIATLL